MTEKPTVGTLDQDAVWHAIDAGRLALADLLEQLSDDEWRRPSLCAGWTVRDVTAHLTQQQVGFGAALVTLIRGRGNLNRAVRVAACRYATAAPTERLIEDIRGMVGSRRHNAGVTHRETLIDLLVHGQDITIPLGRRHDLPLDAAATAASRLWSMRWPPPLPATRKTAGFRLTATDVDWAVGEGPEVQGPIGALLLVGAGRLVALPQLTGPGAPALAARLTA